mgnify:CR=1 FL=1
MMDDFSDLLFTVIALFFVIFILSIVFNLNSSEKKEVALAQMESYQVGESLRHYLAYPVIFQEKIIPMKDVVLIAVNTNNEALFEEKTREYFEKNELKGSMAVYKNAADVNANGAKSLFYYANSAAATLVDSENDKVVLVKGSQDMATFPNYDGKKVPSVTVVMIWS